MLTALVKSSELPVILKWKEKKVLIARKRYENLKNV